MPSRASRGQPFSRSPNGLIVVSSFTACLHDRHPRPMPLDKAAAPRIDTRLDRRSRRWDVAKPRPPTHASAPRREASFPLYPVQPIEHGRPSRANNGNRKHSVVGKHWRDCKELPGHRYHPGKSCGRPPRQLRPAPEAVPGPLRGPEPDADAARRLPGGRSVSPRRAAGRARAAARRRSRPRPRGDCRTRPCCGERLVRIGFVRSVVQGWYITGSVVRLKPCAGHGRSA